jgi:hypothetical protein
MDEAAGESAGMNDAAPFALTELHKALAPGCYDALPAAAYHAQECMSASGAKKILRSQAHYRLMRTKPNKPTATMEFGTSVHDGALEPHAFASRVLSAPGDAPKRPTSAQLKAKNPSLETLDAIEYWRRFDASSAGKIVLSVDEFARARRCIDAVQSHPAAQHFLAGAVIERSLIWRDKLYDVPCKARLDISNHGGVIDLKTTDDASPEAFSKSIGSYEYHLQAWSNFSGSEHVLNATPEFFAFICVESDEPHCVAVYTLGRDSIMAGSRLWDEALSRYRAALDTGRWLGYPETINEINAPRWKLKYDLR